MIKYYLKHIYIYLIASFSKISPSKYWSLHMVNNEEFKSKKDSLNHFEWRNSQYPGYIDLMPVSGFDNKVVLDYGCGPGNDLIGFSEYSNVKELIGVDVSKSALKMAKKRLELHGKKANLIQIEENNNVIPLMDKSVDLIHSSGVLHHVKDLDKVLKEFKRILKPTGEINIMVYNYYSIWVHLYTAYINQIKKGKFKELNLLDAFSKLTDGENVPISKCYKPKEFISILNNLGFKGQLNGVSISLSELIWLKEIHLALKSKSLQIEQRKFLLNIEYSKNGYPLYKSNIAGINACYNFKLNK